LLFDEYRQIPSKHPAAGAYVASHSVGKAAGSQGGNIIYKEYFMGKDIIPLLLQHFPVDAPALLTYDEFIEREEVLYVECLFDWDRDFHALTEGVYHLISVPWPEIRWREVVDVRSTQDLPRFINKKTFLHVFPSLINLTYMCSSLSEEEAGRYSCLVWSFITSRLVLHPVADDRKWLFDFYDSLHEGVVKLVYVKEADVSMNRKTMPKVPIGLFLYHGRKYNGLKWWMLVRLASLGLVLSLLPSEPQSPPHCASSC
jgi:hypothetical protein